MVTRLKGDVTYAPKGRDSRPVQNFMKVHQGDRFELPADGVLQVVYFENGRKASWKGPAEFEAGIKEKSRGAQSGASVSELPQDVSKEIRRVSLLVDMSRLQRTGSSQVRGGDSDENKTLPPSLPLREEDEKVVDAARKRYETLRKEADPQDITPEMYLFSIMADYDQFEEMKTLIQKMRERQPDNDQVDLISEWFEGQI
ncbi:MAG: hypothetical protein ACOCWY_06305 [Thermodesulfobacteriota bacterium]